MIDIDSQYNGHEWYELSFLTPLIKLYLYGRYTHYTVIVKFVLRLCTVRTVGLEHLGTPRVTPLNICHYKGSTIIKDDKVPVTLLFLYVKSYNPTGLEYIFRFTITKGV